MIRKSVSFLLAALLFIFCAGCGQPKETKEDEAAVTAVLTRYFTAPDTELAAAMKSSANVVGDGAPESGRGSGEAEALLEERYGAYFTEAGLSAFLSAIGMNAPLNATEKGYALKVDRIEFRADKSGYEFTASVLCGEQGATQSEFSVTGRAQCTAEHKLSFLQIDGDGGLFEMLKP